MRAVLQRVSSASVSIEGDTVAAIGPGLLVLLGVAEGDGPDEARGLAAKSAELRIFADGDGRFNVSLLDCGGEALVVSQFTLLADVRKGRRPSFTAAAAPDIASGLVDRYVQSLRDLGIAVVSGRFGAHMQVQLENDGPVTILLDTDELEKPRRRSK